MERTPSAPAEFEAPYGQNQAFANFNGTNTAERFDIVVGSIALEDDRVYLNAKLREFSDTGRTSLIREGDMKIGFAFGAGAENYNPHVTPAFFGPQIGLLACYLVAEMAHAVAKVEFKFDLPPHVKQFISETVGATSSWNRWFFGTAPVEVTYGEYELSDLPNMFDPTSLSTTWLDEMKVVLGASGGKESTINDRIFKGAGYEVVPITFKTDEERDGNACVEIIWWNSDEAYEIHTPRAMPDASKSFDAQSMLSIPRYGLLAFTAYLNEAKVLGVGTEFGCSKVWRHSETNQNPFPVHDFSVDEGAFVAKQLTKFFRNYGLDIDIVAPTAVLHEIGILRALHDDGFDLTTLKSCWMAHSLNEHYCGACLKCQRIKRYAGYLANIRPDITLDAELDFPYIGITEGTMLSYSMQYHVTDDYPELPWATALVLDNDGHGLVEGSHGDRIFKFLREKMGFVDTIFPHELINPLELRLKDVRQIRAQIRDVLGVDYLKLQKTDGPVKHKGYLRLPFEDLLFQSLDEEVISLLPEDFNYQGVMARYDWIPMWETHGNYWSWLNVTGVSPSEATVLELPEAALKSNIFRVWLKRDALLGGMDFLKADPHSVVHYKGEEVNSVELLRRDDILNRGGKWIVNPSHRKHNAEIRRPD